MSCGAYILDPARVTSERRDGETVVTDLVSGTRYRLRGSGPALWDLLPAGRTLEELVAGLGRLYTAPAGEIRAAIEPVLGRLTAVGVLATVPETKPLKALPEAALAPRPQFEPPFVEIVAHAADRPGSRAS